MSETGLRVEQQGPALWLTLDRPEHRNALTVEVAEHATASLNELDDSVRAVVIIGTGTMFCPGADRSTVDAVLSGGPGAVSSTIYGPLHGLVRAIGRAPVPVIAALNGPALGGGCDLALACDLRIAVPEAYLACSWVTLGLVPGMGGAFAAQRLAGLARASEFVLLGNRLPAPQALDWGLINAVTDDLPTAIADLVERVAQLPRSAVAANKHVLRRQADAGLDDELGMLGREQTRLIASPDFQQALRARDQRRTR